MRRIYLDRWVWIRLARADAGNEDASDLLPTLTSMREAVKEGRAEFPLSLTHYEENLHNASGRQRRDVGKLMLELSNGVRMLGLSDRLVRAEWLAAVARRFKVTHSAPELSVFGRGVGFVYGSPMVGQIVRRDGEPFDPADAPWAADFEAYANQLADEWLLCGPPDGVTIPGYDPNADRIFADQFVKEEEDQAQKFKLNRANKSHQAKVLMAREWVRMVPLIGQDILDMGLDPEVLFANADVMASMLRDMPVVNVSLELRRQQHRNPERQWSPNDYYDVEGLSVAVVHCDIVVTEAHWADILRRTSLPERHNTTVLTHIKELNQYL